MKILICGGKGQLGRDAALVLREAHEVVTRDSRELDITEPGCVDRAVHDMGPEVILNCAAFTRVDACETAREEAWRVNAEGPGHLARTAEKYSARLIHISTDYVFDGRKGVPDPYKEMDPPVPLSYYGITKLQGEREVARSMGPYMIVRTAWLYGMGGHNFLKTMLGLALRDPEKEIRVVNDQFGSPTWSYRLALQLRALIEAGGRGVYHATAEGYCSWYDVASYFLKKMAVPHRVVPCGTEDYPTPAPRPRNAILENGRLKEEGIHVMVPWEADIDRFVASFGRDLIRETKG